MFEERIVCDNIGGFVRWGEVEWRLAVYTGVVWVVFSVIFTMQNRCKMKKVSFPFRSEHNACWLGGKKPWSMLSEVKKKRRSIPTLCCSV